MSRIKFDDLLQIYRNTTFGAGEEGECLLTVASQTIVDLLRRFETNDDDAVDAGIVLLDDLADAVIGAEVRVSVQSPRTGLGILALTVGDLLVAPGARIQEPKRYFLVDPPFVPSDTAEPEPIKRYRKVLALGRLFADAASFLDATRAELVFIKDGRIVVPIQFDTADLLDVVMADADRLLALFADDLHQEQKHQILFEAVVDLCRGQPVATRFVFMLRNLRHLADEVTKGYKLFASSFSYNKIRGQLEDARIDYTAKIHKTIFDIQNQLLGIPVATVVVASQMKAPTACGIEAWVNLAVLSGGWLFVLLLAMAIMNQWLTLGVIKAEIARQRAKLLNEFPVVSADFVNTFQSLGNRIWWHRAALLAVGLIGIIGAALATYYYKQIAALPAQACLSDARTGGIEIASPPPKSPPKSGPAPASTQAGGIDQPQAPPKSPPAQGTPSQPSAEKGGPHAN